MFKIFPCLDLAILLKEMIDTESFLVSIDELEQLYMNPIIHDSVEVMEKVHELFIVSTIPFCERRNTLYASNVSDEP